MLDATHAAAAATRHALIEAQVMAGAIDALADKLLADCVDSSSHMLEAIRACCQRIEAAVDPILDAAVSPPHA